MNKKIMIITPVYNGEKYIERCILSIMNQTYKNIEHVIVNDGSNDNTKEICEKYSDNIILINKINEGVSKARNKALDQIDEKVEYVLFVDADDWLEETMCEKLIKKAVESESEIVVCGYNNYYENTEKFEKIKLNANANFNFLELITDKNSNFGGFPWNKLIKSSLITTKFDENIHYYENLLFFLENCNNDTKYSIVNECLYNYCINDTSAVHSKKYNIKKITSLTALEKVISLLPTRSINEHKIAFINSYFNNFYEIKKNCKQYLGEIEKFNCTMNSYYKEVIDNKLIPYKTRTKIYLMKNLNFVYYIYKSIKEKINK